MIELVIRPAEKNLGDGFTVRRSLPFKDKLMVGPFIFFDHMGPVSLKDEHGLVVRGHPHIGLATLTFLFNGEIIHRDSLGNEQIIRPFEVNWMTAGKGIAHSERSISKENTQLEGIQVWIALPREIEDIEPNFVHIDAYSIPTVKIGKNFFKLIAGRARGVISPVPVYSRLFYMSGALKEQDEFFMDLAEEEEGAVYVLSGKVSVGNNIFESGTMLCFFKGTSIAFKAADNAMVMVLGGETFQEKRYVWWNFVSSSEAKIEIAKIRWCNGEFGSIINEEEYIPLPADFREEKNTAVSYP